MARALYILFYSPSDEVGLRKEGEGWAASYQNGGIHRLRSSLSEKYNLTVFAQGAEPLKVAGRIPAGYEVTTDSMYDDPADMQEQAVLGTLHHLSKKGQKI